MNQVMTKAASESRARTVARRAGLVARKSRWRFGTFDNLGGFMLVDPDSNAVLAGFRYDMDAAEVIDFCTA